MGAGEDAGDEAAGAAAAVAAGVAGGPAAASGEAEAASARASFTFAGPCTMVSDGDGPVVPSKEIVRLGTSGLPKLACDRATSGMAGCPCTCAVRAAPAAAMVMLRPDAPSR